MKEHPIVDKFLKPAMDWYVAVVLGCALLLLLSSCNFSIPKEITVKTEPAEKEDPAVDPKDPTKPVVVLTFKGINNGVIQPQCLSCHTGGNRDLSSYDSVMRYVVAGKPEVSKLCEVVQNKTMPLGKSMDQKLIDDVCKWITQGAKEKT